MQSLTQHKSTIFTLLAIVVLLALAAFGTYLVTQHAKTDISGSDLANSLQVTEETPYTDLDGNPLSFSDYQGQVQVINSWASWCPFCTKELADFETLAEEYSDQGVVVIAVNRMETKEKAKQYLGTVGDFEHVIFTVDVTDAFYEAIGGFSMPETVFYDKRGNIAVHKRGVMTLEEMRTHTEAALNAKE